MTALDFAPTNLRGLVDSLKAANNLPAVADPTITERDKLFQEAAELRKQKQSQDEGIALSGEAIREMRKARRRLIRERDNTATLIVAKETALRELEQSWNHRKPESDEEEG